jgi:hypothetical protein
MEKGLLKAGRSYPLNLHLKSSFPRVTLTIAEASPYKSTVVSEQVNSHVADNPEGVAPPRHGTGGGKEGSIKYICYCPATD